MRLEEKAGIFIKRVQRNVLYTDPSVSMPTSLIRFSRVRKELLKDKVNIKEVCMLFLLLSSFYFYFSCLPQVRSVCLLLDLPLEDP